MAGRPRAPRIISNNVLTHLNLQILNVIPRDIYQQMTDDMSWITWLAEHRLILNEHQCAVCLHSRCTTLEPIIINHLLPGTIVMSDAWGGYANVGTINNGVYMHEVVVHAQNFVDALRPDVYTQSIEGLRMQVKRKLRYQSSTTRELFKSYIAKFQWRYSQKDNTFGQYLHLLSENYTI